MVLLEVGVEGDRVGVVQALAVLDFVETGDLV